MKINVHIADECGYSESPYITIELDHEPMIGDVLWLSGDQEDELVKKICEWVKRHDRMAEFRCALYRKAAQMLSVSDKNWTFITQEIFDESVDVGDFIFVAARFHMARDKSLHIFLSKERGNE